MSGAPSCSRCENPAKYQASAGKSLYCSTQCSLYVRNIERDTIENTEYGPVIQYNDPTGHIQVGLMSVAPGKSIPMEMHMYISQFIRVEQGVGHLIMDGITFNLRDGVAAVIPARTWHEIINMGERPLKLYTLYCKDAKEVFEH